MGNSFKLIVLIIIKWISFGMLVFASIDCPVDFYVKNGVCTDCPDGTFGPNCTHICAYPTYGRRCILECKCAVDQTCNPTDGCIDQINDKMATGPSATFTINSSITKSVAQYTTEEARKTIEKQPFIRTSTGYVVTQTSSNVSSTTSKFETERLETAREFVQQENGSPTSQDGDTTIIVVIVAVGSIVILLLVVVIAVQIRGKQKKRVNMRETISFTGGHSSTYCEIDEQMVRSTVDYNLIDDYELLKQSETDRTKYSTLPSRTNEVERDGYLSPKSRTLQNTRGEEGLPLKNGNLEPVRRSLQDIDLHYTALPTKRKAHSECFSSQLPKANSTLESECGQEKEASHVKFEQIKKESPVLLRKADEKVMTNVLEIPQLVKMSTDSYIDMDKGSKLDEYVAMGGHCEIKTMQHGNGKSKK